jgi:GNAT superfamily N-acetyltransferase
MSKHELTERIERQALLSWHQAASKLDTRGFDWRLENIGDALCSVSSTERSILVNRVFGLGSESPPRLGQLEEIRNLYLDAGVDRFFLHVVPGATNPRTEEALLAAGYRRYRGWMKFVRGPEPLAPLGRTDLAVRRIGPEHAPDFAAIAASAFGLGPAFWPAVEALAGDAEWHLYMSFDKGRPAGTGAAHIRGTTAYLEWAATHPDFRRRGSQTAILSERIRDALAAGCTTLVTMTGEAVPGDPQHSYRNIMKAGFAEAYLRENWIPADG